MDLTENFYRDFRTDKAKGRLRDVAGHDCADSTQRIARYCGIGGYTATVSTACSSAANAIVTGALLLGSGMADYVVAGARMPSAVSRSTASTRSRCSTGNPAARSTPRAPG